MDGISAWAYVDGGHDFANFETADADDRQIVADIAAGGFFLLAVTTAAP